MLHQLNVGMVVQFHGNENRQSLTIYKAAQNMIIKEEVWKEVFCNMADALQHVHGCGFIHNNLKINVVLETKDRTPSLLIIDLRKSVLTAKVKKHVPKPENSRKQFETAMMQRNSWMGHANPLWRPTCTTWRI